MMEAGAQYLPAVLEFLNKAGAEALRIQTTAAQHVKEDRSIVTAADLAISKMFAELVASFPNAAQHYVIDEEDCGTVSAAKSKIESTEFVWTLDPIDGTTAYANQLPFWGIMVSLCSNAKPCISAIYHPALGELVYATPENAFYHNMRTSSGVVPMNVILPQPLHAQSPVFATQSVTHRIMSNPGKEEAVRLMSTFCAAHYATSVLLGRARACFFSDGMSWWDIAPVVGIARHVGLSIYSLDSGKEILVFDTSDFKDNWKLGGLMVLCHPSQFEELRRLPRKVL